VLGRVGTLKGAVQGIWEVPTPAVMRQVAASRTELGRAMGEARAVLERARATSRALAPHGVMLTVPQ
jgi:hypothetical protein